MCDSLPSHAALDARERLQVSPSKAGARPVQYSAYPTRTKKGETTACFCARGKRSRAIHIIFNERVSCFGVIFLHGILAENQW